MITAIARTTILSLVAVASVATAELSEVRDYSAPMAYQHVKLSPDGSRVAAVLNMPAGQILGLADYGSTEFEALQSLNYAKSRVESLHWASDRHLLLHISSLAGANTDRPSRYSEFFSVDIRSNDLNPLSSNIALVNRARRLFPRRYGLDAIGNRWFGDHPSVENVLAVSPQTVPDTATIQSFDENISRIIPMRVDLESNTWTPQLRNSSLELKSVGRYKIFKWLSGPNGRVQFGVGQGAFFYQPVEGKRWELMQASHPLVESYFFPLEAQGSKAVVLSDHDNGFIELWQYDMEQQEYLQELYSVDGLDIAGPLFDPVSNKLAGVYYIDDRVHQVFFSEADQQRAALIQSAVPGMDWRLLTKSADGNRFIVEAQSEADPPVLVAFDRSNASAVIMGYQYPLLSGKQLGTPRALFVEGRDGTRLRTYLTLPNNKRANATPVVVLPYAGPTGRDYLRFDPWVQFLASQGYAVLQVNYRGTDGFGQLFAARRVFGWDDVMQKDVYDALAAIETNEHVDTDAACVIGQRLAAQSALMAAVDGTSKFRCAVTISAMTDLLEMYSINDSGDRRLFDAGDKDAIYGRGSPTYGATDRKIRKYLADPSPIDTVDQMSIPILAIHGRLDSEIPHGQTTRLVRKAKAAGASITHIDVENGTADYDGYAAREQVYSAVQMFLAKHLKAGTPAVAAAIRSGETDQ